MAYPVAVASPSGPPDGLVLFGWNQPHGAPNRLCLSARRCQALPVSRLL